jgi:hypothetical protein
MKNEVLTLIIGIILGAIISTSVFLVLQSNNKNNVPNMDNMPSDRNTDDKDFKDGKFDSDKQDDDKEISEEGQAD